MNKLLIGLPIAAAVVFVGVPVMTGIVAETKSKELVEIVNVQAVQYGTVEITNYERGLFDSKSSYLYSLAPAFQKAFKIDNIEYDCQVDHGVTGVKYMCLMANKGAYKDFLDKFLESKDPLSIKGNISAFGSIDQTIVIDPLNVDLPNGAKVSIPEQISLTAEFDQGSSAYDFAGKIPKISIEKGNTFDVDDISFGGNVKELRGGLYLGEVKLIGKQFKAVDEKGSVALNDFSIDTSTKESGNTISSGMTLNSKSMEFPNQTGQIDTFSDVMFDASMYGMDTEGLIEYLEVNKELQKEILDAGSDSAAQSQIALTSMSKLIPVAEKLLKKGLGMNVKSSFNAGGTKNDLSMDLSLINEMKFSEMMGFLFSPDETLKNFKGNLNVDFKKELLEKYPTLALAVGGVPFFVQTENGVTLNVTLDSVLKMNGEETTVAELQSLFR